MVENSEIFYDKISEILDIKPLMKTCWFYMKMMPLLIEWHYQSGVHSLTIMVAQWNWIITDIVWLDNTCTV